MISCESDASLNIDFTGMVGYPCSVNIRPWHEGISWSSTSEGETTFHDYAEEISIPLAFLKNESRAQPWVESIPPEILNTLERYEETYRSVVFSTMWFISRNNHACEFFLNQPRLTWLLLRHAKLANWHEAYITFLFSKKRRSILAECGLPPKKSCLNLLAKMSFPTFRRREYKLVRKMLITSEYTNIRHLKIIDEEIINFTDEFPELACSRLANRYNGQWDWSDFRRPILDIKRMTRMLGIGNSNERIGNCWNLQAIYKLHDRLTKTINTQEVKEAPAVDYPQPPISGTDAIIPIANFKELVVEGQQQHHCITSYHDRILSGNYYAYRVTHPERATLGLENTRNGQWSLDQLVLKYNGRVSEQTTAAITLWIQRQDKLPPLVNS